MRQLQVTECAVEFHEDDLSTLVAVGGSVLGTVSAQGNGYSNGGMLDASAAREAAQGGGTHIILSTRGEEYFSVTFAGSSHTNCTAYGDNVNCNSTYTPPQTQTYAKPNAEYVVVRVPPENWTELPAALQPVAKKGFVVPPRQAGKPRGAMVRSPAPTPVAPSAETPSVSATDTNLTGVWVGAYAPGRIETIRIEHVGSNVNATKITGDANVPAGKPTFRAILVGSVGEGMGHGADVGYQNPRWYPGELRVLSQDHIEFAWLVDAVRSPVLFTRQTDVTNAP